jgi:hypothetical protein
VYWIGGWRAVWIVLDCGDPNGYREKVLPSPERSDEIALLCAQLPVLRRLYEGPVGARARVVLDRAVAAVRAGAPVSGYLAELGIMPAGGSGDGGGAGGGGAGGGGDGLRSLGPTAVGGEPVYLPGRYVCPRNTCTRTEYRTAASGLPECDLFDLPLRFTEER